MILQTERLILRPFREADIDAYAEMGADPDDGQHGVGLYVFKTAADQFVSKISYFRVIEGPVRGGDLRVVVTRNNAEERISTLLVVRGKEQIVVPVLHVGDIGAATKLTNTVTGDTLCDKNHCVTLDAIEFPNPLYGAALHPKSKNDTAKISPSIARLVEEDPSLRLIHDQETHEMVLRSHLIEELMNGHDALVQVEKDNLLNIMTTAHIDDGGFQALSPMPDAYIYGTHTYNKGAAVMHNLRGYMGDEAFRNAMRDVQAQYANTAITAIGFKDALEAVSGQDLDPFFDAWVFAPGYAVFEVRNWNYTQNGSDVDVELSIGQKLYGATVMHNSVPLELSMVSADGQMFDTMIVASGVLSNVTVQCPFVPEMVVLNRYQKLNQARMDHEITIVPGVTFSNSLPYVDFRVFQTTLVDTTLVRVDHIWSGADQTPLGAGITDISTTHYWNVDGVWPEGTDLSGRLI